MYIRNGIIYEKIVVDGKTQRVSTGIKKVPDLPFKKMYLGNSARAKRLNEELFSHVLKLKGLPVEEETGELHLLMQRHVEEISKGITLNNRNQVFSASSIKTYRYVADKFRTFVHANHPIDIYKFDLSGLTPQKKKERADRWNSYFSSYKNHLIAQGLNHKSVSEIMNMTSLQANYWAKKLFVVIPSIQREMASKKQIIVLSPEFIPRFINDTALYETLSPELKMIWEVSATIMFSTLRISDVLALQPSDFTFGEECFLNKLNSKTKEMTSLPVPDVLKNIYAKNWANGCIFSTPADPNVIYANIRELFKLYSELHVNKTANVRMGNGQYKTITKPLYEWVHPHLLRKSAITSMIYHGISVNHIKHASGHSKNSSAFNDYVTVVDKYFKSDFKGMYEKIYSKHID